MYGKKLKNPNQNPQKTKNLQKKKRNLDKWLMKMIRLLQNKNHSRKFHLQPQRPHSILKNKRVKKIKRKKLFMIKRVLIFKMKEKTFIR